MRGPPSVSNGYRETTGPDVSSRKHSMSSLTPSSTVGSKLHGARSGRCGVRRRARSRPSRGHPRRMRLLVSWAAEVSVPTSLSRIQAGRSSRATARRQTVAEVRACTARATYNRSKLAHSWPALEKRPRAPSTAASPTSASAAHDHGVLAASSRLEATSRSATPTQPAVAVERVKQAARSPRSASAVPISPPGGHHLHVVRDARAPQQLQPGQRGPGRSGRPAAPPRCPPPARRVRRPSPSWWQVVPRRMTEHHARPGW